uniref:Fumarylacetoacetase-like C-terminal domain-containing protein n=1 Tax=Chromera velia CCMP2878 TaxID=1169474 RepID=A0A0G4G5D4_9ALVE|mmetsp:Transcript_33076/g.65606  ORF Transcript_33076/g.65606 Transcript_33076/m.65606 type:complete len:251 (-) Transcript_33076:360-1112(-)|eukprot:Cvel_20365.t1-p1 / transcript=Cvel_20365.t1 / gene=Cvel_20365 / organism=Chromera_velia_CCMP2878 / gene_product=Acylpyruvase FAHD1, mitochondrial, putative / transcript_product=Acylpyruvase FAHD1, mitochondrial, putative / location=Cvel_scaffold1822:8824-10386(+) / protein_length=250 / sequence_SO=supercontig / SO=protein_coding / is_pseudo=false
MRPASNKIICVGRNYAKHCLELGNELPKRPLLFLKPPSSVVFPPNPVVLPADIGEIHHEVELVAVIGKGGKDIPEHESMSHVSGFTLALDLTARDLQAVEKKKGNPWTLAKMQDGFLPISDRLIGKEEIDLDDARLCLHVMHRGESGWTATPRQDGNVNDMIFKLPCLISYISSLFTLSEGDLILTGTPSGVGPILPGDKLKASIRLRGGGRVFEETFEFSTETRTPAPGVAAFPVAISQKPPSGAAARL